MPDFLFDLPLLIAGPAIVGSSCLFGIAGLLLVRRFVLPRVRVQTVDAEFSSAMLQGVLMFYGLAVALIAVNVWQTYTDVSKIVSQEATALGSLYRDVSNYPGPIRLQLREQLRDYVDNVIQVAWPLQQRGRVPTDGVELMNRFQVTLTSFEPATEGQKVLHGETFRAYNQLIQARRLRLDAVGTKLPGILWFVIIIGGVISLLASFLFKIDDLRFHALQVLLLAAFIGLVIFMILALDRPFRGDLGLRCDPYQLICNQLMKSETEGRRHEK
jgi:hypothetical protein